MLWKIYFVIFLVINVVSVAAFDYSSLNYVAFISLALSCGLNVALFNYAFKKKVLPEIALIWLFRLNIGLFGLFAFFELITFVEEVIGFAFVRLPTSGLVSIIASFPSLPALYATYKLAYVKISKKKAKRKS